MNEATWGGKLKCFTEKESLQFLLEGKWCCWLSECRQEDCSMLVVVELIH